MITLVGAAFNNSGTFEHLIPYGGQTWQWKSKLFAIGNIDNTSTNGGFSTATVDG